MTGLTGFAYESDAVEQGRKEGRKEIFERIKEELERLRDEARKEAIFSEPDENYFMGKFDVLEDSLLEVALLKEKYKSDGMKYEFEAKYPLGHKFYLSSCGFLNDLDIWVVDSYWVDNNCSVDWYNCKNQNDETKEFTEEDISKAYSCKEDIIKHIKEINEKSLNSSIADVEKLFIESEEV